MESNTASRMSRSLTAVLNPIGLSLAVCVGYRLLRFHDVPLHVLNTTGMTYPQPAVLLAPAVVHLLADTQLADDLDEEPTSRRCNLCRRQLGDDLFNLMPFFGA